jgi:branched-chain amino acid transport system permease protein
MSAGFRHVVAALVLAGLLVYWSQADYFGYEVLAEVAIFAILAMSLDLVAGYTGLVSLGHAALFGCGAYIFAALSVLFGWPVGLAMAAASVLTALLALVVGAVVTRVQGIFFIMITLAIGQMGHEFFFQFKPLGGDDGFAGIERLDLSLIGVDMNDPATFALAMLVCAAAVYIVLTRILASPFGALLAGLHDNPARMRALGLPVKRYQTAVFGLSGLIAGFAGTLTAQHILFITPNLLDWTTSGKVLVMVILGGLGTLAGAALGAVALVFMEHELAAVTDYWGFWMGIVLIAVVMGGRNGAIGWLHAAWRVLSQGRKRRPTSAETRDAAG